MPESDEFQRIARRMDDQHRRLEDLLRQLQKFEERHRNEAFWRDRFERYVADTLKELRSRPATSASPESQASTGGCVVLILSALALLALLITTGTFDVPWSVQHTETRPPIERSRWQ